jgi:uncharacterized protein YndB with AHSA1/START domain
VAAKTISATVVIDASPAEVYEYFTRPEAIVLWMGQTARLNPTPGGEFAVDVNGARIRGRYLELEPPNRLVFSWGFSESDALPPGASTVEVILSSESGGTRVDIRHVGLPDAEAEQHASGWPHFLAQLAAARTRSPRASRQSKNRFSH